MFVRGQRVIESGCIFTGILDMVKSAYIEYSEKFFDHETTASLIAD